MMLKHSYQNIFFKKICGGVVIVVHLFLKILDDLYFILFLAARLVGS